MVKAQVGDTNIFNISQPDDYRCQIHHYHSRVSRLYLSVFKGQSRTPIFYLLFSDVAFFDCPVNWQGADFSIGSQDDCIELMLNRGLIGQAILQFPNAYASITEYARLFICDTSTGVPVRLIANAASMIQSLPSDLA